jgi:hypothetical protein
MKRARTLGVLTALLIVAVGVFIRSHYEPRRERPEGWRTPWDAVPLDPESGWSLNKPRREVIQNAFFQATNGLSHCNNEYFRGSEALPTKLELLVEVTDGLAQLTYVVAEPNAALPPGLLACVEHALEKTPPSRHPLLQGKTERWRLSLNFLVHPAVELPETHWWTPLVPESWRNYGDSAIHVG